MNLPWCHDPGFWVDVAGVLATAIFSWLLYLASVRSAKAAEGATRVSETLLEEQLRRDRFRRTVLQGKVRIMVHQWNRAVAESPTVPEQLVVLLQLPPRWDEEEVSELSAEAEFAGAILKVGLRYDALLAIVRALPQAKGPAGLTILLSAKEEEDARQRIEAFRQAVGELAAQLDRQDEKHK